MTDSIYSSEETDIDRISGENTLRSHRDGL